MIDPRINATPPDFDPATDLPDGFMDFLLPLHREFTPRQQEFAARRAWVLSNSHRGILPNHLPPSEAVTSDWRIDLPDWCVDQRNQMTGPADDAELVVKMLNSGAPGVMLDLEDSEANFWPNLMQGGKNILSAIRGELTYHDQKRGGEVAIKPSSTVVWSRVRGLHLSQAGLFPNKVESQKSKVQSHQDLTLDFGPSTFDQGREELVSASLFDVAMLVYQVDVPKLKHPLSFYVPKSESAEEALWWNDLFNRMSEYLGQPSNYIKCMALVESHPLAFQMEEFLFNLRDHILGLNLGRWDYMASLIHFNFEDPNWVLPDRNTIPHNVPFFQNLRELIPEICHKRGVLAIGGMTALYPSRVDTELNERALKVLAEDKRNEALCLMDGAWTGHPDQNEIAVSQFPYPNQMDKRPTDMLRYPDLRPAPTGVGKRTLAGTRAAVRTVIRYRNGVLNGKGASLLDGYMEDLATDRIYRLMIAQRMRHSDTVAVLDDNGQPVKHTPELVSQVFDEELDRLLGDMPSDIIPTATDTVRQARQISETMILSGQFDPV